MLTIIIQGLARSLDLYNPVHLFPERRMRDHVSEYLGSDIETLMARGWEFMFNADLVAATHVLSRFSLFDRLADALWFEKSRDLRVAHRRTLPAAASKKLGRVGCHPTTLLNQLITPQDSPSLFQLAWNDRESAGVAQSCANKTGKTSIGNIPRRNSDGNDIGAKRNDLKI